MSCDPEDQCWADPGPPGTGLISANRNPFQYERSFLKPIKTLEPGRNAAARVLTGTIGSPERSSGPGLNHLNSFLLCQQKKNAFVDLKSLGCNRTPLPGGGCGDEQTC